MPADVKIKRERPKDPMILFQLLVNGDKRIKIKESEKEKYIQWKMLGGKKYQSSDKKYKVYYSNELQNYVVTERVSEATKEPSENNNIEYVKTKKAFCSECYQLHSPKDILYISQRRARVVCKNCKSLLYSCSKCNKLTLSDDFTRTKSGKDYCYDCSQNLISCARCSNFFEEEDQGSRWHQDLFYCSSCVQNIFKRCGKCGGEFYVEDMRIHRSTYYCIPCMDKVVVIKEYNFTPEKFNFHKLDWDNKLCLGLEIEVETNCSRSEDERWASKIMTYLKSIGLEKIFYIKHDGTVKGFELVSHPATLQYIHKNIPWFQILKWFRDRGFTSYKGGNCGLHVHLSKDFFTPLDVHKLRLFFATNKIFIYKFSKRFGYNDKYCQYESFDNFNEFLKNEKRQDGKYWAIRTRPGKKNTVELRVFRGTLSFPRFIASLQFCDALAHYVKMVSIISCQKKSSWVNFTQWCTKTNEYQHFIKYISNIEELNKTEV